MVVLSPSSLKINFSITKTQTIHKRMCLIFCCATLYVSYKINFIHLLCDKCRQYKNMFSYKSMFSFSFLTFIYIYFF